MKREPKRKSVPSILCNSKKKYNPTTTSEGQPITGGFAQAGVYVRRKLSGNMKFGSPQEV
jgi:hypothetical protein